MGWLGQGNIVPKANVGSVKLLGGRKWLHWLDHPSEMTIAND